MTTQDSISHKLHDIGSNTYIWLVDKLPMDSLQQEGYIISLKNMVPENPNADIIIDFSKNPVVYGKTVESTPYRIADLAGIAQLYGDGLPVISVPDRHPSKNRFVGEQGQKPVHAEWNLNSGLLFPTETELLEVTVEELARAVPKVDAMLNLYDEVKPHSVVYRSRAS